MKEKDIQKLMQKLDCTREEAIEILQEDEAIDKMTSVKEVQSDLSEEQKKAAKAATITGSKKRTSIKRERKVDATKKKLIDCIRILIEGLHGVVEPLKNESEMHFTFNGDNYTIRLIKHRPPKK